MNTPHTLPSRSFNISAHALALLWAGARRYNVGLGKFFRAKAHAVLHADKPRFDLNGGELDKAVELAVGSQQFHGLQIMAERMGVPFACAAELVATANVELLPPWEGR